MSTLQSKIACGLRDFFRIVMGILREIGDENAYQRHLAIHGVEHSAAEWRRFCDERWLKSSRRARCC